MSSSTETVQCPNCGNEYKSVAGHWARSSTCDYPELDPGHREALAGLLLTGGDMATDEAAGTADYRRASTNKELLEWMSKFFGVFAPDITLKRDGADAAESSEAAWADEVDGEFDDMYAFRTRRLPELRTAYDSWHEPDEGRDPTGTTDAGKRMPRGLTPTPLMLKVIYACKGNLIYRDDDSEATRVQIHATAIPATDAELQRLFNRFSPRLSTNHRGQRAVQLQDSEAFFDYIENDPYTPEPLPGCEGRWPTDEERASLSTVDGPVDRCHDCGGTYQNIAIHWQSSDTCTFPNVPDEVYNLLTGVLIVGASVPQTPNQTYYLETNTTDRAIAEFLQRELGSLAGRIEEREPLNAGGNINNWAAYQSEETFAEHFDTVYRLKSHGHPVFEKFRDWYESMDGNPATKHVPEADIDASPALIRGMYAYRGLLGVVGRGRRAPSIFVSSVNASAEFFERLFDDFGGELHAYADGRRRLLVTDIDAFFRYIGDAPDGLEHKWPAEYGGSVDLDGVTNSAPATDDPLGDVFTRGESE